MSIRAKIILAVLSLQIVGLGFFVKTTVDDLKARSREPLEELLVDTAETLAQLVVSVSSKNNINITPLADVISVSNTRKLSAQIYDTKKESVDLRVYVTDQKGVVIYHSVDPTLIGSDYSRWNDVFKTLKGEYGARSTRDNSEDPTTSVLYVGSPLIIEDTIIGVLTVGKPAITSNKVVERSKQKILYLALIQLLTLGVLVVLLTILITRPLSKLVEYVRSIKNHSPLPAPKTGSEIGELTTAISEMREELEGKEYVERYVQNLTHELKSPISAIKGAAEILKDEPPSEQKVKFLDNILRESSRMETTIGSMLELAVLERRKVKNIKEDINLSEIIDEVILIHKNLAEQKAITLSISIPKELRIYGDRTLLLQCFSNILKNSLDFSPCNKKISITAEIGHTNRITTWFTDQGPGIPEFALSKIFDRFFSLPRPDGRSKGSGLGLSIVKEIVDLHKGDIKVFNHKDIGFEVKIVFPTKV